MKTIFSGVLLLFTLTLFSQVSPTNTTPYWPVSFRLQTAKITAVTSVKNPTLANLIQLNNPNQGNQKGYKLDWLGVNSDSTITAGYVNIYVSDTTGAKSTITLLGSLSYAAATPTSVTAVPSNFLSTPAQMYVFNTYNLLFDRGQNVYVGATVVGAGSTGSNIIVQCGIEYY